MYPWIVDGLSTLGERDDDCASEPSENGVNPIEREGVPGERVVGLYGRRPGGGERMIAGFLPGPILWCHREASVGSTVNWRLVKLIWIWEPWTVPQHPLTGGRKQGFVSIQPQLQLH